MDIVLEVLDTFIGDRIYANLIPAPSLNILGNSTSVKSHSTWSYKPATSYLYLEPSEAAYMSAWSRDNIYRQSISLFMITWIFGLIIYFIFAALSYIFIFDKRTLNHPKFLKNQVWLEFKQTNKALPVMALFTAPLFILEVRGYGRLYDTPEEAPAMWYNIVQFPFFIAFTDFWIYWIHRWLHHPLIYKWLHKPHHKWIMPTPFSSHAFHPFDGFMQSLPYHVFPFLFPLQKLAYVALFVFVNFWTILIHDGEYLTDNPIVNGAACHSLHHSKFEVNYGQFTTFFDRMGGTYRKPDPYMFEKELKMSKKTWEKEAKEVDELVVEVEGHDDRTYSSGTKKNQ